jgi:hypothetical protein
MEGYRYVLFETKIQSQLKQLQCHAHPRIGDVVLYLLLNLLNTRVPINIAADNANPKYEKFLS